MKNGYRWQLTLGVLVSLGFVQACNDDGGFTAPPELPPDTGTICAYHEDCQEHCVIGLPDMAPYCSQNCSNEAPCPAGYVCVSRGQMGLVCAMGECAADADCPASYTCETELNVCQHTDIACTADGDCPAAIACNQGVCETVCASDDDCKQGFLCQHNVRCVQCLTHGHCDNGFACLDGHCNEACVAEQDCRYGYECSAAACQLIDGGGAGQVGEPCTEHSECEGFCAPNGICNLTCEGPEDTTTCPDGYLCNEHHLYCNPG